MKRIAIIGGGAAGLAASIAAAGACRAAGRDGAVTVYEMDARVGRRILVTGNGRCNFSNTDMAAEGYRNAAFVAGVYEALPPVRVLEWFYDLGLMWSAEADGRLLPATGKASTVVDVLRARMAVLGVEECCNAKVERLMPPAEPGGTWTLALADGRFVRAEALIVAAGGQDGLSFLPDGVPVEPFAAVLGPLKTVTDPIRGLDGIRVRCRTRLLRAGAEIAAEEGELLFRKYGVSGICIFNLSRFARKGDVLSVNLLPDLSAEGARSLLAQRVQDALALRSDATWEDVFRGMVLPQVAEALLKAAGAKMADPASVDSAELAALATVLQDFRLKVEGIAEPAQCQVHRGGVAVDAVSATLESVSHPDLFFAGEALDVDGPCGGYNLHWAWSSGILAGTGAAMGLVGGEGAAQGGETR